MAAAAPRLLARRPLQGAGLPAKVMLLIALSRPDGFPLPYDRAPAWYGVSSDSAEEGLRELRATGLLAVERNWVKAPRSETGWTGELMYTLQGSFSTVERKKVTRIRNLATTVADDEVAPVRRIRTGKKLRLRRRSQDPA